MNTREINSLPVHGVGERRIALFMQSEPTIETDEIRGYRIIKTPDGKSVAQVAIEIESDKGEQSKKQ
jgi:hypothetical protein